MADLSRPRRRQAADARDQFVNAWRIVATGGSIAVQVMIDAHIARRIVELMNEALSLDSSAVNYLCSAAVVAEAFIEHPTIQVSNLGMCRLVGLLNGIAGTNEDSLGAIAAVEEKDGSISGFIIIEDRL